MKNSLLISLFISSLLLIFLSQQSFYPSPIKTVYRYDGSYKVGGDRFDKNDKKLESFTYKSYIEDGKLVVEEVDIVHYTFWGKVKDPLFFISICLAVVSLGVLLSINSEKIKKIVKK